MTETAIEFDLMLALDDMPALPCESASHGDPKYAKFHDDGPATHYVQARHQCVTGKKLGEIFPVCSTRAARLRWLEASGRTVICLTCGQEFDDSTDWMIVVGPVRGRKK